MKSRAPLIIAIVLLLLPVLYVGSYLALVMPGNLSLPLEATGYGTKEILAEDCYRFSTDHWAERTFWPLEQIDRMLRPELWEPVFNLSRGGGGATSQETPDLSP